MTALTIPQVRAWRPGELDVSGRALGVASEKVDGAAAEVGRALENALVAGVGDWAEAARRRAAREARTGRQLADALDHARTALTRGAADVGDARTHLLGLIDQARAGGFTVSDDGTVTAPTLPPVMSAPEHAAAAAAERNERQAALNAAAQAWADDIAAGLVAVGTADHATATALTAVEVPQTLESAVDAYLQRALASKDLIGSLGAVGAGGVALALALKKAVGLFGRSSAFLKYLQAASAPITDYQTFLKNLNAADDALAALRNGKPDGGLARYLLGTRGAQLAGRAFLPLTVLTGLSDAVTGGGYDGARGWATRGLGLAGAGGAGALLAGSAGLVALGPVGVAVAGVAVLGYGAWTLGNAIYDNWDDIKAFGSSALEWTGDRISDAADGVRQATDWAGDRLADAGKAVEDLGKSALSTVSFGLL